MKQVCQPSSIYWPGRPIKLQSGIKVWLKRTTWLAVALIPMGSHHERSMLMEGSERSHASSSCDSTAPVLCLAPPGPAVLTNSTDQQALPALVAKALAPSTTYPPSTLIVVVPNALVSKEPRTCGSPLQATHI